MYYFNHGGSKYCIDATADTGRLGRFFNHSKKNPNCFTKVVEVQDGQELGPRLVLLAKRDISIGEELVFDYNDQKNSKVYTWLRK